MSVKTCIHMSVLPPLLDKVLPEQSLNPTFLDLHISPPAGAQLHSGDMHLRQAPTSLSGPGHIACPQAEVFRHTQGPF